MAPERLITVSDARVAAQVVLPTKESARLEPATTAVLRPKPSRPAWEHGADSVADPAEATEPTDRKKPVHVLPQNLAAVSADAIFVHLLAGPLQVPALMVGMAPFLCGFPFGDASRCVWSLFADVGVRASP